MRKYYKLNVKGQMKCPDHISIPAYQCEAAALLPRHTAVAGLLLTAALLGRCFFETAANSPKTCK